MEQNELIRLIADTLDIEPNTISLNTTAEEIDAWDSMGTMSLQFMLSKEFEIDLAPNQTDKLRSVDGIVELIQKSVGNST